LRPALGRALAGSTSLFGWKIPRTRSLRPMSPVAGVPGARPSALKSSVAALYEM